MAHPFEPADSVGRQCRTAQEDRNPNLPPPLLRRGCPPCRKPLRPLGKNHRELPGNCRAPSLSTQRKRTRPVPARLGRSLAGGRPMESSYSYSGELLVRRQRRRGGVRLRGVGIIHWILSI